MDRSGELVTTLGESLNQDYDMLLCHVVDSGALRLYPVSRFTTSLWDEVEGERNLTNIPVLVLPSISSPLNRSFFPCPLSHSSEG